MGLWSLLMAFLSQLPSNVKLDDLSDWSQRLRPQRTGMWWKKEDSSCFSYVIEDGVPFKWNAVVAARKLSVDCWDKCCEGYCVLSLDPSSIIHHPSSIDQQQEGEGYRIQDTHRFQGDKRTDILFKKKWRVSNGTRYRSNSAEISLGEMIPTHHTP